MNDPEVQNRSFAAIALGYLPNSRSYELLSGLLRNDAAGEVRSSAAAALGYLGERRALPELRLALLEDIHWSTRVSAAVSLGLLHDERAFDVLVDGLRLARRYQGEEGQALKRACLGSLGELGMPQAISHLVFYAQERDFLTRQILAEALGRLLHRARRLEGDRATQRQLTLARECLEYLARDDHGNVRRAAQLALANLSLVSE
jgi:HEAT repeat protein